MTDADALREIWRRHRPEHPELWPSRVRFHGAHVVSEWYCLDRRDGSTVWERSLGRLNTIVGIHDGVALCGRLDPGRRPGRGAAALRLSDGASLWTKALTVVRLDEGRFVCADGRVHDLRSAEIIGREAPLKGPWLGDHRGDVHWSILATTFGGAPVPFGDDVFLTIHGIASERHLDADYCALDAQGRLRWKLSLAEMGYHATRSGGDRFARPPFLYVLTSRERPYRHVTEKAIQYVPCQRFLLLIDARTGRVAREIDLGVWTGRCEIGDVDAGGVVLRLGDEHVVCFAVSRPGG